MSHDIHDMVRANYSALARDRPARETEALARIAASFGYSEQELSAIPAEANLGVSCGNPVALASLKPGETVLDLGCGGGMDVFLAAEKVGPQGRVIGLDMTAEMIALARANAARRGDANVEFVEAPIEAMPLAEASIDCVISNCVLNLVPDKDAALREIFRVLKPGGRLAVSDIALKAPLPGALEASVTAWVGCIAGAMTAEANREALQRAGFTDIAIIDAGADLNVYKEAGQDGCCAPSPASPIEASSCCGPAKAPAQASPAAASCCGPAKAPAADLHTAMGETFRDIDLNAYAASVKLFAIKPAASS